MLILLSNYFKAASSRVETSSLHANYLSVDALLFY